MSANIPTETVILQYWNGKTWQQCGQPFFNERNAWLSLGGDDSNYRTIDSGGNVLTDKRTKPSKPLRK